MLSKKVSDSVTKKFGIGKSFDFGTVQILGIVTHWMHVEARGKISSGGLKQRSGEKNMQRGFRLAGLKTGKYAHPFASYNCP